MTLYRFYRLYRRFGCGPVTAMRRALKAVSHHALS